MPTLHIPYAETGFFSPLVKDYLDHKSDLSPFYSVLPELSSFPKLIEEKSHQIFSRELLYTAFKKGYDQLFQTPVSELPIKHARFQFGEEGIGHRKLIPYPQVEENLEKILDPNTFTITTGHQLNIFTGPLFTIYKIISTINLAKAVEKANPRYKMVPVFWMATEDHDFKEINHLDIQGKKIEWDLGAQGATGRLSTQTIGPVVSRFLSSLGLSPALSTIESLMQDSYLKYGNLAQATMALFHQLFGSYGLLILDADQAPLKKLFSEIIQEDLFKQISHQRVLESNTSLEKLGYPSQIHPRPINFFYLKEGIRERLVESGENGFQVLNTEIHFSRDEIIEEIKNHPDRFSPNVVLRPLYQEKILPNLAYIGGGAEVSYWLSLKSTFDYYKIPFPALFLRNSAILMGSEIGNCILRLGFKLEDIFKDSKELIRDYVLRASHKKLDLMAEKSRIQEIFQDIHKISEAIDPTLSRSAMALATKTLNRLVILEKKLLKKEKDQFDIQISQILKIKQKLFPNHSLQERTSNYFEYFPFFHPDLMNLLIDSLNPLDPRFTLIIQDFLHESHSY